MNTFFSLNLLVAFCSAAATHMVIDKITVINNCKDSVYFGQSDPRNAEVAPGDKWTGKWMMGGDNVQGRLMFTHDKDAFKPKVSGDSHNAVWVEVANNDRIVSGQKTALGGFNFANQVGYIDLDLEISALGTDGNLVCKDAKARTALDTAECNNMHDGSGKLEQFQGRPYCHFTYGADQVTCSTSLEGVHACTSAYANYISDHSMLWQPENKSATAGHWLVQPRSTGRSSGEKGMPTKDALYADHFVGRPTLNGRVGCDEHGNGGQAVNFECFESCCYPQAIGKPSEARQQQCEAAGGVTAGTQGFLVCNDAADTIHIANLEIVTCPAHSKLSPSNVKMPSCPTGAPQNPPTFSLAASPGLAKNVQV